MKKLAVLFFSLLVTASVFAFEWPQKYVTKDSFSSYFGQLNDTSFTNGIIFTEKSEIKTSEDGNVAVVITEHDDDFGWFESPLGNCVIIEHDNDIQSCYGNLDKASIPEYVYSNQITEENQVIGKSASSGWKRYDSGLIFMIFDVRNKASVNPRILMPTLNSEQVLALYNITLQEKYGRIYDLNKPERIKSGTYYIYKQRQLSAVPYKTTVSVNGSYSEGVNFEVITSIDGKAFIKCNNKIYSKNIMYPDNQRILVGIASFGKGKNTLAISVETIIGTKQTLIYQLETY